MGCRGVLFALSPQQSKHLLQIADADGDVIEFIQEEIEEAWDEEWLCETDKAWDAIHRCLTDGTLATEGKSPLEWCVLGGRRLYEGDDYIVSFVKAEDVAKVTMALEPLAEADFRRKYDLIDPEDYGVPLTDEDFGYTWEYFTALRDFYRNAASAKRDVIFSVDQ